MSLTGFFKKIFGSKAERDYKKLQPTLAAILEEYKTIDALDNDALRAESAKLRELIRQRTAADEARMVEIKEQMESPDLDVKEKVQLANESEKLVKKIDEDIEAILNEILPKAFAIMKSTARRFAEGKDVVVTASEFDRALSTNKDFVTIDGDKAVWHNHWMAGGNEITWDMVHYDVQLIGGTVLHQGKIAEMATGEGKTLVATLPVFLNALAGKGVHVVTVNDYLSKRDAEWMGPLYQFHGLSVDCIDKYDANMEKDKRRRAYNCDITFGTNNEFGFDYLRDNMATDVNDLVQRKHHYAIVDEVDSVLIDDARTPLIISGRASRGDSDDIARFMEFRPMVEQLYGKQRALVVEILNNARKLISEGNEKDGGLLLLRAYKGLPKYKPLIKYLSEPGIKQLLQKTEDYYMQDNEKEMHIATDPLYFVLNEKQNTIDMTDNGHEVLAHALSDPDFFVIPDVGSALAELEKENLSVSDKVRRKDEIMADFALKSDRIHTVNQLLKAYAMFEKDVDYVIIDNKVKIVDEQTGRIMEGRRWSDGLHQAVEAKENVKVEESTQTMATISLQNYFRMYHKLAGMTGTAETEAGEFWSIYKLDVVVIPTNKPIARIDQTDLIYKTEAAKFNAVVANIAELMKEGRPVLVGTTDVETSEKLSRMLRMRGINHQVLNAKQHAREAEVVAHAGQKGMVTIATNMAGRGTDIKLSDEVRAAGGLAIIGTERHDSRRVDRQLRGRAGRQGDPGTSIFYISLEDKLMRRFGSDRIAGLVDRLGMPENEALESPMLSRQIESSQKKVEEIHFGTRKRLLEYDDVMNSQREVIYTKRRNALRGDKVEIDVLNMMQDMAQIIVDNYEEQGSLYVNIALPITDGRRVNPLTLPFNLKKCYESKGKEIGRTLAKYITLIQIDNLWKDHLQAMDDLRQSVQNASYEQKDPLLIYKLESFNLFTELLENLDKNILSFLLLAQIPLRDASEAREAAPTRRPDPGRFQTSRSDMVTNGPQERSRMPMRVEKTVGRNDPCPCGSGKKYKNCHGKEN